MKIVRPKVEEWIPKDDISHVARCARVCYALKTGRDDGQLYDDLIKSKHLSMLRHESYYCDGSTCPLKEYKCKCNGINCNVKLVEMLK